MESFFENANRILDVAATANTNGPDEFAVLIGGDGGIRLLMNQPFRLEAAAAEAGSESAYRVLRSESGVRVEGHRRGGSCMLQSNFTPRSRPNQSRGQAAQWLLDQPLYRISSPLLTSTASAC